MILYLIMGLVVIIAVGVIAFLFYFLKNDIKKDEQEAKPVLDLTEFKKDIPLAAEQSFPLDPVVPLAVPVSEMSLAEETYRQRVVELEEELRIVSEKSLAQAQEALNMIDQLKKRNEELEEQMRVEHGQLEEKLGEAGEHLTRLRQDKSALQNELDVSRAKIVALEDEVVFNKKQMEVEIARVNKQVEDIGREKDEAVAEAVNFQVANMKTELDQAKVMIKELQELNAQLKAAHDPILAKNEVLEYELMKNKAQVSGLERACENYKVQVEELLLKRESGVSS